MAELLNLSTTVSAQSDAFVRGIENCRGGLRNLIASLDPVAQATDRFNRNMATLDRALAQGKVSAADYGVYVERLRGRLNETVSGQTRLTASTGQLRGGMQQLSYQLGDVAQGFAAGTPPMTIFIQQSGQIIQSLQLMTNSTKGLLGFLGGPWGLALSAAAVAIVPLIGKLAELVGWTDKAAESAERYARAREYAFPRTPGADQVRSLASIVEATAKEAEALVVRQRRAQEILDKMPVLTTNAHVRRAQERGIQELNKQIDARRSALEEQMRTLTAARDRFTKENSKPPPPSASLGQNGVVPRAIASERVAAQAEANDLQSFIETMRADNLRALQQTSTPYQIGSNDDPLQKAFATDQYYQRLREMAQATSGAVKQIEEGWNAAGAAAVQMATDSLNALSNLATSIKNGGILSVLTDTLNLLGQLAKSGVFGGKIGAAFAGFSGLAGFRANGGPVSSGKAYVVGERRPEIFVPNRSGYILPDASMAGGRAGATRIEVIPSPYFQAVVRSEAEGVAAPIGMRAAQAGSNDAQRTFATRQKNRIPGR